MQLYIKTSKGCPKLSEYINAKQENELNSSLSIHSSVSPLPLSQIHDFPNPRSDNNNCIMQLSLSVKLGKRGE
ncbi:unnamed protein product [Lactuca virosa]|uniref:Uncharacterized protein n=1 Tax=Lactuca virosa TaxID=75947 RepID=A0AAU9PIT6_9ASTR|nr:unnamed protein product [Lactuca virosa]